MELACLLEPGLTCCNDWGLGGSLYTDIRNGKLKLLPGLSAKFQHMLKSLMAPSATDRPSASKILSSSVLSKRATTSYAELPFVVVR